VGRSRWREARIQGNSIGKGRSRASGATRPTRSSIYTPAAP
jgi:hypothetical protein